MRILHDYVVFDPLNDFELVPLDFLDDASQHGRGFEAAGFVAPLFLDDDDDDAESDEEDNVQNLPRLRTSSIFQYSIDYTTADEYVRYVHIMEGSPQLTVPPQSFVHRDDLGFLCPGVCGSVISPTAYEVLSAPSDRATRNFRCQRGVSVNVSAVRRDLCWRLGPPP